MPIKTYRPVTATRRFQTVVSREEITKQTPEKSLVESKKRTGGRNSHGRISSRFIGGGAKQSYRVVISSGIKRAYRRWWQRLSTTRTARPGSRC
jgi:ribosomal protein L2